MSNASGFASRALLDRAVKTSRAEVAAARRMVVEYVPEEDEHRVLDMLGLRHG